MREIEVEIKKIKREIAEINRYKRIYGKDIASMERMPKLKKKLKELREKIR